MTRKQIYLIALSFVVSGTLSAIAGLETNVLSFPIVDLSNYRPDAAVNSANAFIAAGRERACATLENVVEGKTGLSGYDQHNQVCLLCRLLFIPKTSSEGLRPPMLGDARLFSYSMSAADWPDLPFVIVSNVPLSIITGYVLDGTPESGKDYLAYCEENGTFRTKLFTKPSATLVNNALNQVFESVAWKAIPWNSIAYVKNTNAVESAKIVKKWVENALRAQITNSYDRADGR